MRDERFGRGRVLGGAGSTVRTEDQKQLALWAAEHPFKWVARNVNELAVAKPSSLGQRTNDTSIGTKVRAQFVNTKEVPYTAIGIVTERDLVESALAGEPFGFRHLRSLGFRLGGGISLGLGGGLCFSLGLRFGFRSRRGLRLGLGLDFGF